MQDLQPVHNVFDGKFDTVSDTKINICYPKLEMFNIEDIARGLSNICRFGGQINDFYSVAQHSCLISMMVPHELRLAALMHDASEAYLGDVIKPLKVIIGEKYESIEDQFMRLIFSRFEIDFNLLKQVKPFDSELLETEWKYFKKIDILKLYQLVDAGFKGYSVLWTPNQAYNTFLTLFNNYTREQVFTVIFTKQDNTTKEVDVRATTRLCATKIANQMVGENDYKHFVFADAPHQIGTL